MKRTNQDKESTLLVACPEYCNAGTSKFNIWPQVVHTYSSRGSDKVKIIFLNCTGKNAIAGYMKSLINELKHAPQELQLRQHIAFFEETLKKITNKETPIYDTLLTRAASIIGFAYATEENILYVQENEETSSPPIP